MKYLKYLNLAYFEIGIYSTFSKADDPRLKRLRAMQDTSEDTDDLEGRRRRHVVEPEVLEKAVEEEEEVIEEKTLAVESSPSSVESDEELDDEEIELRRYVFGIPAFLLFLHRCVKSLVIL